jgi:hypothetical protein
MRTLALWFATLILLTPDTLAQDLRLTDVVSECRPSSSKGLKSKSKKKPDKPTFGEKFMMGLKKFERRPN